MGNFTQQCINDQTNKEIHQKSSMLDKQDKVRKSFFVARGNRVHKNTNVSFQHDYNIKNPPVAEGSYASVHQVYHKKTNQLRAAKIINQKNINQQQLGFLKDQIKILQSIVEEENNKIKRFFIIWILFFLLLLFVRLQQQDHPNVIQIFDFYDQQKTLTLISQYCSGGELLQLIFEDNEFTEAQAANIIKQVLSALTYCHNKNIIHRELKPENILYYDNKREIIQIVDFGIQINVDSSDDLFQQQVNFYYTAPEVLKQQYDEKCDVWSIGVILYVLLYGQPPFGGTNNEQIIEAVESGEFEFPEYPQISEEALDLISQMLILDPQLRISSGEALCHPWMYQFEASDEEKQNGIQLIEKALYNIQLLKDRQSMSQFQELAWLYIVNNLTSREQHSSMLKSFRLIDIDCTGQISQQELIDGFGQLGIKNQESAVDQIFQQVDMDNDGMIDYTEWMRVVSNRNIMLDQVKLRQAFKSIDMDDSGKISLEQMREVFDQNQVIQEEEWLDIIAEADIDEDGNIDFKEFTRIMRQMLVNQQDKTQDI